MKSFSEKVREQRLLLELNQQELAELVGVSTRSIIKYEVDGVRPRPHVLHKLAKSLQVSPDYLDIDEIQDPLYGIEKTEYVEEARALFGNKAAREVTDMLERNNALFAGGELSQEAKDAYFEAVMRAYLTCKEAAKETYGRKKGK